MTSPEQPARPEPEQQLERTATGETDPAAAPATESVGETSVATSVTVHRSPRYFSFMIVGAVVGAIAALLLTVALPQNREYDPTQVFGFLLLAGVVVGVALGSVVALIVDRAIGRKTATVVADRLASSTNSRSSDKTD
ncbi:MAG: hypothetical protein ABIX44_06800 [Cryobacterium sp.]